MARMFFVLSLLLVSAAGCQDDVSVRVRSTLPWQPDVDVASQTPFVAWVERVTCGAGIRACGSHKVETLPGQLDLQCSPACSFTPQKFGQPVDLQRHMGVLELLPGAVDVTITFSGGEFTPEEGLAPTISLTATPAETGLVECPAYGDEPPYTRPCSQLGPFGNQGVSVTPHYVSATGEKLFGLVFVVSEDRLLGHGESLRLTPGDSSSVEFIGVGTLDFGLEADGQYWESWQ